VHAAGFHRPRRLLLLVVLVKLAIVAALGLTDDTSPGDIFRG
jgi:hypothetical protein